jgi:hypothetical protein
MSEENKIYRYRLATSDDALTIFALLEEVASEIAPEFPSHLNEQREAVLKRVETSCDSGETWIALDRDDQIVGFLMAEPLGLGLELSYGGVKESHRGNDIFPDLVAKMKAKGIPLRASVAHSNDFQMPDRLRELGFVPDDPMSKTEAMFLWKPELGSVLSVIR